MSAFLTGDTIDLRPLDHDDIHLFYAWFADREVVRYSLGLWQFPQSRVEVGDWLDRTIHDKGTLSLGITRRDTHELIGYAGITSISVINRSGEYYILDCCDLDLRVVHLAGGQRKSLAHLMLLDGRAAIIAMLSLR